ncbi:MAG: hypothetical protein ABL890_02610 [Candidatus Peribacteraceae bacterium]
MQNARHRHAVAFPLFVVGTMGVLGLSMLGGASTILHSRSVALQAETEQRTIALNSTTTANLQPDARFTLSSEENGLPRIDHGEVIVDTTYLGSVSAGESVVTVIDGAFSVLHTDLETIVAPLSAPVLVEEAGKAVIVPQGYQYRVGTGLASIPMPWIQERAKLLADPKPDLFTALTPLTVANVSQVQEALVASTQTDILPLLALTVLASGQPLDTEVEQSVLAILRTHDVARASVALTLPQIARFSGKPLTAELLSDWSDAVVRLSTTDRIASLDALSLGADAARIAHLRGYPVQSSLWEQALSSVSPILLATTQDPDERDRIVALNASVQASRQPLTASLIDLPTQTLPVPVAASTVDPVRLLAETSAMLQRRRVLQTANTEVILDAAHPGMARVRHVFKEEDGVLIEYAFSYDPATDTVAYIVRGPGAGESLPNALSGEVFFR